MMQVTKELIETIELLSIQRRITLLGIAIDMILVDHKAEILKQSIQNKNCNSNSVALEAQ